MSTIGGGAASGIVDNLSALLEFVKSPDYLERIRELRDLEESSRLAHDDAVKAQADAEAKLAQLASQQQVHAEAVQAFEADKATHAKDVGRWQRVLAAADKALRGED